MIPPLERGRESEKLHPLKVIGLTKEKTRTSREKIRTSRDKENKINREGSKKVTNPLGVQLTAITDPEHPKPTKRRGTCQSPQAKKLADIQYQADAPIERLTFGPTPLQTLVEKERGGSPEPAQPAIPTPFDSPLKQLKGVRKSSKTKKELADLQKVITNKKQSTKDSKVRSDKDRLQKDKTNDTCQYTE